jgi:hypothetical protein
MNLHRRQQATGSQARQGGEAPRSTVDCGAAVAPKHWDPTCSNPNSHRKLESLALSAYSKWRTRYWRSNTRRLRNPRVQTGLTWHAQTLTRGNPYGSISQLSNTSLLQQFSSQAPQPCRHSRSPHFKTLITRTHKKTNNSFQWIQNRSQESLQTIWEKSIQISANFSTKNRYARKFGCSQNPTILVEFSKPNRNKPVVTASMRIAKCSFSFLFPSDVDSGSRLPRWSKLRRADGGIPSTKNKHSHVLLNICVQFYNYQHP